MPPEVGVPAGQPAPQADPEKPFTIVDASGQLVPCTEAELRTGAMLNASYTQKCQDVAAEKQALEQERMALRNTDPAGLPAGLGSYPSDPLYPQGGSPAQDPFGPSYNRGYGGYGPEQPAQGAPQQTTPQATPAQPVDEFADPAIAAAARQNQMVMQRMAQLEAQNRVVVQANQQTQFEMQQRQEISTLHLRRGLEGFNPAVAQAAIDTLPVHEQQALNRMPPAQRLAYAHATIVKPMQQGGQPPVGPTGAVQPLGQPVQPAPGISPPVQPADLIPMQEGPTGVGPVVPQNVSLEDSPPPNDRKANVEWLTRYNLENQTTGPDEQPRPGQG